MNTPPMEIALQEANTLREGIAYSTQAEWYETLGMFGLGCLSAFVVGVLIFAFFRISAVREFFSPLYRLAVRLPRRIINDYEDMYDNGRFELNQSRAIFMGLCVIGFLIFAGLIASSFLTAVATLATVAMSMVGY